VTGARCPPVNLSLGPNSMGVKPLGGGWWWIARGPHLVLIEGGDGLQFIKRDHDAGGSPASLALLVVATLALAYAVVSWPVAVSLLNMIDPRPSVLPFAGLAVVGVGLGAIGLWAGAARRVIAGPPCRL